jgi:hypothetical protein
MHKLNSQNLGHQSISIFALNENLKKKRGNRSLLSNLRIIINYKTDIDYISDVAISKLPLEKILETFMTSFQGVQVQDARYFGRFINFFIYKTIK